MSGSLNKLLASNRKLTNTRAILDRLAHRLREGGPAMTREEIRREIVTASNWLNELAPRSILRQGVAGEQSDAAP